MEYSGFYDFALKEIGEEGGFEAYASTFGGEPDLQGDVIAPHAFSGTIKKNKAKWPMFMSHITSRIIGFITDASEDERGLFVRGEFTLGSSEGKDAAEICRHAARIKQPMGLSIGYAIPQGGAEVDEKTGIRTLKKIDLLEISIAALPANPRARMVRVKNCATLRDAEHFLRDLGLTGDEAREFISFCKAERDAKPLNRDLERDAKESGESAIEAFLAEMRQLSLCHSMKGII